MKKIGFPFWVLIAAAAVMALTLFSGVNGMYFFDLEIPYNYGYLLGAGFKSYSEIINPLTPLCGYLVLLGYKLFGLNFVSGVIITAILSAAQVVLCAWLLAKAFGKTAGLMFAVVLALPTLPVLGTLYYNNLVLSYYALLISVLFARLFYKNTNALAGLTWAVITIAALTKLHIGVLFGAAVGVIELNFIMDESKTLAKKVFIKTVAARLAWCAAAPALGALILMFWINWDIKNFLWCITMPLPTSYLKLPLHDYIKWLLAAFTILPLLCATTYFKGEKKQSMHLILLTGLSIAILSAMYITTIDHACIVYMTVAVIMPLYYYWSVKIRKIKKLYINILPVLGAAGISAIVLFSTFTGSRKMWNEDEQTFINGMTVAEVKYPTGFFKGVKLRRQQYNAISIIQEVSAKYPQKKIFFGPSLEFFYPATNRLPPQRWILWSHPGVSFNPDKLETYLSKTFRENNYDIVFINPYRIFLYLYFFGDLYGYNKICYTKALPWVAYLVKDEKLVDEINPVYKKYYPNAQMYCNTVPAFFTKQ